MKQLALLLVLHQSLVQSININDCPIDYRSRANRWEQKLIQDLNKCNHGISYKPPPQNNSEPIRINVKFTLKSFNFNSEEQAFFAHTRFFMSWYDERLKWDPTQYYNIQSTALKGYNIWTPGISLTNSQADFDEYNQIYFYSTCVVESDGMVRCVSWENFEAVCGSDLSDWPFDAQACKLEFGPFGTDKVLLDVNGRAITMIGAEYGTEWDITDYQQELDQSSNKTQLKMTFRLERHADVLSAIVIFPSMILTVLTLSTLLIDFRSNIRLVLICFSLMCHFDFLTELAENIPKHSKEPPRLLLYYRGSFILTSITIVLSFILDVMSRNVTACPKWITSFNDFVYKKFAKIVIWPRWENQVEGNASASKVVKDWTDFANVMNTVWIIVSVIVYLSLYCVFMPHPIPFNT